MTRERALELAAAIDCECSTGELADAILAAVAEAQAGMVTHATIRDLIHVTVTTEREACAKIAESADGICGDDKWDCCAEFIRDAIRERGIPLKVGA